LNEYKTKKKKEKEQQNLGEKSEINNGETEKKNDFEKEDGKHKHNSHPNDQQHPNLAIQWLKKIIGE